MRKLIGMFFVGATPALFGAFNAFAQTADPMFSNQFESGVGSMAPGLTFARVGTSGPGIGGPIAVTLIDPAVGNVFVPITSSDPTRLTVNGGGVTITDGMSTANVAMTALASSPQPVLLRANLGNQVYAAVRVVDNSEQRTVISLLPTPASIAPGGMRSLIAQLDLPAPLGGQIVNLAVSPINAGSMPATISVATDSFSQTFDYTDLDISEFATVSASIAATPPAQASIVQSPIGKLVINEVDYDQPAVDDLSEYIEIYNRSPDTVPLDGLSVYLVNGNLMPAPGVYGTFVLTDAAASLPPGGYLVIGAAGLTVPPSTPFIAFANPSGNIQNGAPDGIAIVDTAAIAVIDALSYEGSVTGADLPGFPGPVNLVEGAATPAVDGNAAPGSLSRIPNGTDNNNAASDFALTGCLTPGTGNQAASSGSHLVINEVDYDQIGVDANSFIEIFNPSCNAIALDNFAVVLVNGGGNAEYARFAFPAATSLAAGGYLVIRNNSVTVPLGTVSINASGDFMQNGAPDGVALINTVSNTLVDALSYEGSITAALITGFPGPVSLVEGTAFAGADTNDNLNSLARSTNGGDSDNAVADWILTTTITPGFANP